MKENVIPHIVKEFNIGNTKVKIADNYCKDKSKEVDEILNRIAMIALQDYRANESQKG
ncbi:MAG: hypothetical protein HFE57_09655 [Firmicutes bacterium]|jgi:hypothetical protein|nr:hypothetical protein [Bacillota bacterium]